MELYGVIGFDGLLISYEELNLKCGRMTFRKILKSLTVTEKHTHGKPKGSPLIVKHGYQYIRDKIAFPRIKYRSFINYKMIKDVIYDPMYLNYLTGINYFKPHIMSMPLYEYQNDIVNYLIKYFNNINEICYLQMDTGLGKTRIALALVNALKCSTLIIVPTIAIGYQWIEECNALFPTMTYFFYHNIMNKRDTENFDTLAYDIVIVVINTFCKKDFTFLEGYGFMIYDEAHEYYTTCNSKALWNQTKYVLGLSATPSDRPDELDSYVSIHLGKPILAEKITNIKNVMFKVNVKCINYRGSIEYTDTILTERGTTSSILTIGNIIQDPIRIMLIVDEVNRLYQLGHGIFVFAEHRNFLDVIKESLLQYYTTDDITIEDEEKEKESNDNISILRGGISNSDYTEIKKKGSHIILTTYGYSRRGISITEMTALIMASPRRNGLKQIIGRILRRGSDESIVRQVIDIVDINTCLKSQYYDRKKIYIDRKYEIETEDVPKLDDDNTIKPTKDVTKTKNVNIFDIIYE